MKRITLPFPAVLLAFGAAGASAQEPATPATPTTTPQAATPSANASQAQAYLSRRLTTLLDGITLTTWQRGRVDSIVAGYATMLPATPPDNNADSTVQERWRVMLPRLDSEVRMALTGDQQRIWDRNLTAWRSRMPGIGD